MVRIKVNVIVNRGCSYKFSVNKDDASDLGLKAGERYEIEVIRKITQDTFKKELNSQNEKP